jgi:hypothetical protein
MGRYNKPTSGGSTFRLTSIIKCNSNNNGKGVPLDVIHSLHTGVLYFQNVSQFYVTSVNVILFASIREVQQHGRHRYQQRYVQICCTEFFPDRKKVHKMWTKLYLRP